MSSGSGKTGQALAAAGGLGLGVSLWLPWYSIHFPPAAVNSVVQMSQQFGALGPLMRAGAQLINQLGPFHVTAWQAFSTTPAVILGAAIIGGGLALLALAERAGSTSQVTMLAGVVGAVLVGYRIAVPPSQSSFVHPAWAIYLALLSALAMLAGGALSASSNGEPEPMLNIARPAPYPPAPSAVGWPSPNASAAAAALSTPMPAAADPFSEPSETGVALTRPDSRGTANSVPPPSD